MTDHTEAIKHAADAASIGVAVGTVAGWLPAVAALFTIVWTGIRIFESRTMQRWLKK